MNSNASKCIIQEELLPSSKNSCHKSKRVIWGRNDREGLLISSIWHAVHLRNKEMYRPKLSQVLKKSPKENEIKYSKRRMQRQSPTIPTSLHWGIHAPNPGSRVQGRGMES
uniref:Uncharacterized protein n=1 Tax=Micrurus paraensis TaxID=1970185 RepID=A0A2D4KQ86_9SAUR